MNIVIESIKTMIAELSYAQELAEGVITGTPWVVQLAPGAYLVSKGGHFGVGSVMSSVCYSPEHIDAAVNHIVEKYAHAFPSARKLLLREALKQELSAAENILTELNKVTH